MASNLTPYCNDPDCINPRYSHRHEKPTDVIGEPECSEWCGTVNGRTVHEENCPYRQYFHHEAATTVNDGLANLFLRLGPPADRTTEK